MQDLCRRVAVPCRRTPARIQVSAGANLVVPASVPQLGRQRIARTSGCSLESRWRRAPPPPPPPPGAAWVRSPARLCPLRSPRKPRGSAVRAAVRTLHPPPRAGTRLKRVPRKRCTSPCNANLTGRSLFCILCGALRVWCRAAAHNRRCGWRSGCGKSRTWRRVEAGSMAGSHDGAAAEGSAKEEHLGELGCSATAAAFVCTLRRT